MKFEKRMLVASIAALLFTQPCLAQFEEAPSSGGIGTPVTEMPSTQPGVFDQSSVVVPSSTQSGVSRSPFVKTDRGTFYDSRTNVHYLAENVSPGFYTRAEAEEWLGKLCDGKHGLRDGSKPGDWRIPTMAEMEAAWINREGAPGKKLDDNFADQWPEHHSYLAILAPKDRGEYTDIGVKDYNGKVSLVEFAGNIWPVRSGDGTGARGKTGAGGGKVDVAKDLFQFKPGKIVFVVDQLIQDSGGHATYSKSVPIKGVGLNMTLKVKVYKSTNFHVMELTTPGINSLNVGRGIGSTKDLFDYCDDWYLRPKAQTVYASGESLTRAGQDLQTRLGGVNGWIKVYVTGDTTEGKAVITIWVDQGE